MYGRDHRLGILLKLVQRVLLCGRSRLAGISGLRFEFRFFLMKGESLSRKDYLTGEG